MAVKKVIDAGTENEIISDDALKNGIKEDKTSVATGASDDTDAKQSSLDKRQEMLKKAMERHKRGVKIKEVVVGKTAPAETTNRKMTKEELMKKRTLLDQRLKMVDESRENNIDNKLPAPEPIQKEPDVAPIIPPAAEKPVQPIIITPVAEKPVAPSKPVDDIIKPEENKPLTLEAENKPAPEVDDKPSHKEHVKHPAPKDASATHAKKPSKDGSQYARPHTPKTDAQRREQSENRQYNSNRNDGRNFARPFTPRAPGENLGYIPKGEKPAGTSNDRPSYQNRGERKEGGYQGRTGAGGGADKDGRGNERGGYGGDRRGGTSQRPPARTGAVDSGGLTLTQDEERRRLVKKKIDDPSKDIDKKNKVGKKDSKKAKSWVKTIYEGIDELNIEKEIDKPISPLIDISDLADVDPDKQRARISTPNYRARSDKRPRRKGDRNAIQNTFVRPTEVSIGERIVISDFGSLIGVKATELTKKLFAMDIMATVNQSIDSETAQLLGIEYGIDVNVKAITEDDLLPDYVDDDANLVKRPPIVTVMGHVDHGKTSLLDAIRSTSVVSGEAGGITQHIGAYEVESSSGKITFLDTPGHEAFTTLRARGALLTDIVILVVAADDGVKPQTKEAIDHAKAAGVRIVVAINKIDKDGANPDKVRQQLSEHGIISDEWGGDYQFQEISAKKRIGIDDLLERVLLEADVLDLKGNPNRPAEGIVIESRLDKQKGPVATILVKNGTLKKGDTFISGNQFGKVRAMFNFKGMPLKEATVSVPCEIMGFSDVPQAGEKFIAVDERIAKQVAELRAIASKEKQFSSRSKLSLADFFTKTKESGLQDLNIVLKADAQGSVEALSTSLTKLSNQEVRVNIIHDGIGAITESDVALANASDAIIIGFNVRPDNNAKQAAEKEKIDIELYSIIYKAIDDVKLALEGMLTPDMQESIVGKVEIRQIFSVPKLGKIAGSFVTEGKILRTSSVRVIRDSIVIFDGKIGTLKRFADDVKEVVAGYECGLSIDKYQDIKEGDVLEVYDVVASKRTLADVEKSEALAKIEDAKKADELRRAEEAKAIDEANKAEGKE